MCVLDINETEITDIEAKTLGIGGYIVTLKRVY